MTLSVGIYLFDQVEVLDFAGPYEVFTCAARVHGGGEPLFRVFTLGDRRQPVRARAGLAIEPDYAINDHPAPDCLIIPGGVADAELEKSHVVDWIDRQAARAIITVSVCTGAFLLAKTGRLNEKSAATHWEDIPAMRAMFPTVRVQESVRWVDEGSIVSSAGISAGIDMCLHLVERLAGRQLAVRTARQLEFDWVGSVN